ncbi:MAG: DUF4873 domain-containing protein [Nocardioidaceae bacterium]
MSKDEALGYRGSVRVRLGGSAVEVEGQLHGFFQPIDGSYHWYGRLAPDERISAWVADRGRAPVEISVGADTPVPARLGERNPRGGHRVTGTGPPPHA